MIGSQRFEFPPEQAHLRDRARRYAWRSIVLVILSGIVLFITTGRSQTMKTAWITDVLSIVPSAGLLLVGLGMWWADAAAAAIISLQIVHEGWQSLLQVVGDLMDEAPTKLGTHDLEELPGRVKAAIERLEWVREAAVRLREHGHL